ncbi:MAG: hypothetical protein K2N38_12890 [Oscillospiraceae bacterium]|nr:hypothetical protein [Oscillospiraceae bacterium]
MKTLERWLPGTGSKEAVYTTIKPMMERLATELGSEWELVFDDDAYEAKFTHGAMRFVLYLSAANSIGLRCGNGKINYTPISSLWHLQSSCYIHIDILEADDRNTIVMGFKSTDSGYSSYGFNLIWGKYDDGSEYLVWGAANTISGEQHATLLDDTATVSRSLPNVMESTAAPWCFGKLPKTDLAALPTSLYFGTSVPYRAHYIELLRGDKKFVGFAAAIAGSRNALAYSPPMFAVPVETFDIEHIKI